MPDVGDYGMLSDCHTAALVSREGSIDWLCLPRFDAPSVFGRLLDANAGYWRIVPAGPFETTRRYDGETLVLVTRFVTEAGEVELTDCLALAPGARGHEIGLESPHAVIRSLRCLRGQMEMRIDVCPRFEYGLTRPRVHENDELGAAFSAGPVTLFLRSTVPIEVGEEGVKATFSMREGDVQTMSLQYSDTFRGRPSGLRNPLETLEDTKAAWQSWAKTHWGPGLGYEGLYGDMVRRSALVLQGLTYQPSGAVVAAPTTSLPEILAGTWNWDYRYAWLRDASLMMRALWVAACPDEPERFFEWIGLAGGNSERANVQIVYGVEGERDLTEHELTHLEGYEGSKPVRVGNDAWMQSQLDVLGEVLDAALLLDPRVDEWSQDTRALLVNFADQAAERWRQPDAGMWEARDKPRNYTSSKVMCWVALDRAVQLADRLGVEAERLRWWERERDSVRETTLQRAWSTERGCFAGAYDSDHLDASVLLMPLVGFLPASDLRVAWTIETIERELSIDGLVRRWEGEPNGFMLTSFWLVQCLVLGGALERARARFEEVCAYANDLGLLAEEGDPATRSGIGNFPQAFSHVGLVNAAWELTVAEQAAGGAESARMAESARLPAVRTRPRQAPQRGERDKTAHESVTGDVSDDVASASRESD